MICQTRIFAPFNNEFGVNWAENIMGRIIKPGVKQFKKLKWFWFSRYNGALQLGDEEENCVVSQVKDFYNKFGEGNGTRSLRFRFELPLSEFKKFSRHLKDLIDSNGCFLTDFRKYKHLDDLGSNRHLGRDRNLSRRVKRANLLTMFYYATSLLTLDNIRAEPTGSDNFQMEVNDAVDINETFSSFTVPHHLFCNITDVPTNVFLNMVNKGHFFRITTGSFAPLAPGQQNYWTGLRIWQDFNLLQGNTFPNEQAFKVSVKF